MDHERRTNAKHRLPFTFSLLLAAGLPACDSSPAAPTTPVAQVWGTPAVQEVRPEYVSAWTPPPTFGEPVGWSGVYNITGSLSNDGTNTFVAPAIAAQSFLAWYIKRDSGSWERYRLEPVDQGRFRFTPPFAPGEEQRFDIPVNAPFPAGSEPFTCADRVNECKVRGLFELIFTDGDNRIYGPGCGIRRYTFAEWDTSAPR